MNTVERNPTPLQDYLRDGLELPGVSLRPRRQRNLTSCRRMGVIAESTRNSLHIGPLPTQRFGTDEYVYFTVAADNWDERGKTLILHPTGGMYVFPAHQKQPATQVALDRPGRQIYPITPNSPPFVLDRKASEHVDLLAPTYFAGRRPDHAALADYVDHLAALPQPLLQLHIYAAPDFLTWCGIHEGRDRQDEHLSGPAAASDMTGARLN